MSFLDKIKSCNRDIPPGFVPFTIGSTPFGCIAPERVDLLRRFPKAFAVGQGAVAMRDDLATAPQRSAAMAAIADDLAASGFARTTGELYAIKNAWNDPDAMRMDRGFVAAFGARAYGVHVNGFVHTPQGLALWIGTRAADREVEPGKRDNVVAGGQPAGLSLIENVIKECDEEAGFPAELARTAKFAGHVSYRFAGTKGVRDDVLFCYDIELPADVVPQNRDGEIQSFELIAAHDVLAMVRDGDDFKFNVPLVIIDFGIRHGLITPETEPEYAQIVAGLRRAGPN
ncbi:MAG: DUF4743 domain-containing protein [Rhodobacteraceae bacterium]|nr:DUF4743 domain-containing protein [Paracoccaceae bacterium]